MHKILQKELLTVRTGLMMNIYWLLSMNTIVYSECCWYFLIVMLQLCIPKQLTTVCHWTSKFWPRRWLQQQIILKYYLNIYNKAIQIIINYQIWRDVNFPGGCCSCEWPITLLWLYGGGGEGVYCFELARTFVFGHLTRKLCRHSKVSWISYIVLCYTEWRVI